MLTGKAAEAVRMHSPRLSVTTFASRETCFSLQLRQAATCCCQPGSLAKPSMACGSNPNTKAAGLVGLS